MMGAAEQSDMPAIDTTNDQTHAPADLIGHAIIAGYGVPGRAFAEWLTHHQLAFVVIEQNAAIVERCGKSGTTIIAGNVSEESTLIRAGIERASVLALCIPLEAIIMETIPLARKLNPKIRIIARVAYVSSALEAIRKGADETVVAEELAAREFVRLLEGGRAMIHSAADGVVKPTAHVSEASA
jgi:voltage-gated potassium channel Kch